MKYLQLPCDYFEQPNIRQAIRKDEGFGELVLFNLIMKIDFLLKVLIFLQIQQVF